MSPLEKNLLALIEETLAESQIFLGDEGRTAIQKCLEERLTDVLSQSLLEEIK